MLLIVPLLLGSACVSSGRYQDLEQRHSGLEANLDASQARIAELESELGIADSTRSELEGSIADQERALEELRVREQEAARRIRDFQELTAKFQALVDAGTLRVKVVDGRMLVELQTDVLFPSGSAQLSPDGQAAIDEVTALLTSLPEKKYQIEGHTDDVPIHTAQFPSNWELASARALNVLKSMVGGGMPPERVSAVSYGSVLPRAGNDTDEGRTANRRIEIVVAPDLSGLPGFAELEHYAQAD